MSTDDTTTTVDPADLRARYAALAAKNAHLRARDAAAELGVSEGQLVAMRCGEGASPLVVRLREDWPALFAKIHEAGRVMALTRNDAVVCEVTGDRYPAAEIDTMLGQAVGSPIDMRFFFRGFGSVFAVRTPTPRGELKSVQIFGPDGTATHKVYFKSDDADERFSALVSDLAHESQSPSLTVTARVRPNEKPDGEIDVAGLRAAWAVMTSSHEFHGLLRRFGVTRTQALRLADPGVAQKLATSTLRTLLERAAEREVGLMFFTRSEGALQVRSGTIKNVKVMDDWLNVLDPGFSMHIAQGSLAQAWRVRKPSNGGVVTSLELYDAAGDESLVVYGVRGAEGYDAPGWRAVIDDVES